MVPSLTSFWLCLQGAVEVSLARCWPSRLPRYLTELSHTLPPCCPRPSRQGGGYCCSARPRCLCGARFNGISPSAHMRRPPIFFCFSRRGRDSTAWDSRLWSCLGEDARPRIDLSLNVFLSLSFFLLPELQPIFLVSSEKAHAFQSCRHVSYRTLKGGEGHQNIEMTLSVLHPRTHDHLRPRYRPDKRTDFQGYCTLMTTCLQPRR